MAAPEARSMALTRNSRHTVIERIRQDPLFAHTLLNEAQTVFVQGEQSGDLALRSRSATVNR